MASRSPRTLEDLRKLKRKSFKVETDYDISEGYYVLVIGPEKSPHDGGMWKVLLQYPDDYPLQPPDLRFINYIYHPNIYDSGFVSKDALKENWSPECDVVTVFEEFLPQLLMNPDPRYPANEEAAKLIIEDKAAYVQKVKELNETNASPRKAAFEADPSDSMEGEEEASASEDATSKGSTSTDGSLGGKESIKRPFVSMASTETREVADFMKLKQKGFKVELSDPTPNEEFFVRFFGPKDSPYEGGVYKVRVQYPGGYPLHPPELTFWNNIYHPNIEYHTGTVSTDEIKEKWSPEYDVVTVFEEFLPQLLINFNPKAPLNKEAAKLVIEDNAAYLQKVKESNEKYATPEEADFSSDTDSSQGSAWHNKHDKRRKK